MNSLSFFRIFIPALLLFVACKPQTPQWEATYSVPLIKSSLGVNDIVADSLLREESDQSLTLVYRNQLEEVRLDSLVNIKDNSFTQTTRPSDLELPNSTFEADITLGMIALNWPFWGPLILAQNGSFLALPDITGMTSGPHPSDIQDIFEEATFSKGFMDITLTNEFPADVANVDYEIKNANSGTVFLLHSFPYVASGATSYATIDLTGRTLEGTIDARLLNMDYLGGNNIVLIDTSKALDITITLRDMEIESATALFPAQNVVEEQVYAYIEPGDAELTFARLKKGNVRIDVVSTAQDTVYFDYKIPGATKNGKPFETSTVIPPAAPGSNVQVDFNYDFSNYVLDLRGPGLAKTNLLYSELVGRIDSTGQMVTISLQDSLQVSIFIEDIEVESASGFFGSSTFEIGPETFDFKLFRNVVSGNLSLSNVSTHFSLENELGVSALMKVDQLTAINSNTQQRVDLIGTALSQPITVERATQSPLTASFNTFELSSDNSNITELINVMPDQLEYQFSLSINDGVDSASSDYGDFFSNNAAVKSSIDIEMPLSITANQLQLKDTAELSSEVLLEFDGVESGDLNFIVYNGFPLSTNFQVEFLNAQNQSILSFTNSSDVKAGVLNNGRVTNPEQTILNFPIAESDIQNISSASKIVYTATFNTTGSEEVKIYSDYQLVVIVSGDLKYANK